MSALSQAHGMQDSPEAWVAARFRALRKDRGWSQQDLARRMEDLGWPMHQTTIAKLEAAKRPISLNEVAGLAALFGFNLGDFLAGVPELRLTCSTCKCGPPIGFTCNTCGRSAS